jgi:hypothetical protein
MKMRSLAIASVGMVIGLAAAAPGMEPRQLTGHYTVRWEEQSFTPCGASERWWVSDPGPLMARWRELVPEGQWGTVFVTVRAEVTDRGMFGHMGMYPRAVAIREVTRAAAPGQDDCRGRGVEVE